MERLTEPMPLRQRALQLVRSFPVDDQSYCWQTDLLSKCYDRFSLGNFGLVQNRLIGETAGKSEVM